MGDWIKRGIVVACVILGALKGYAWFEGRDANHQLIFKVDGPPTCRVRMHHEAGAVVGDDEATLAWESAAVETRGHAAIVLRVEVPLSCGWQPEQVHCAIDRDGSPWKTATAERVSNPRDGALASYLCRVEGRATE